MTLLVLEDCPDTCSMIIESVRIRHLFDEVYKAATIEEAMKITKENMIDIFVVDIGLPDGSGYDFIHFMRSIERYKLSWVVVITGAEESVDEVLKAYNSNLCQRYIKKPFKMAYLCDLLADLQSQKMIDMDLPDRLLIRRKSTDYYFEYDDIVYLETVDKTAYLYTIDQKHAIGRITLNELEQRLPESIFARVHRSYIINRKFIHKIQRSNNQNLIIVKYYDNPIPIGRTYKEISL